MNTENGKIDYRIMLDTSDMEAQREQVSGMFQGLGKDAIIFDGGVNIHVIIQEDHGGKRRIPAA